MQRLALAAIGLIAIGCSPKHEPAETPAPTATAAPSGGGVAPMTSGVAGGMTPVSGGESVNGAGMGGLGSAATNMARGAAAKASAPPSMGSEGGE